MLSVFDDNGDGTVDYRELILGLESFKDSSIDDKIRSFFRFYFINGKNKHYKIIVFLKLCDADSNGSISQN